MLDDLFKVLSTNAWINGIKYILVVITTISGILTLIVDFRDQHTRRLTKTGKRVLVLVGLTGLFSILLQTIEVYKDEMEEKEKRIVEETNQREIRALSGTVSKSLTPIRDIDFSIEVYPNDTTHVLLPWYRRINKEINEMKFKDAEGIFFDEIDPICTVSGNSSLMPNRNRKSEKQAYDYLFWFHVDVDIYKEKPVDDGLGMYPVSDLGFSLSEGIGAISPKDRTLIVDFIREPMRTSELKSFDIQININHRVTNYNRSSDAITTFGDLDDCWILLRVNPYRDYDHDLGKAMVSLLTAPTFREVSLGASGRVIKLDNSDFELQDVGINGVYLCHYTGQQKKQL